MPAAALPVLLALALTAPAAVYPLPADDCLPILAPTGTSLDLGAADPGLAGRLEAESRTRPPWLRLVGAGKLAFGVVDLHDIDHPRWGALGADTMMYAASLPKIALLLAAEQALEDHEIEPSAELNQDLHDMIRVSSNQAATRTIDRLGFDRIAAVLTRPDYRFYDPDLGGGLWVGKRFAKLGDRHGDPLRDLSHAATVHQILRFYYLLARGQLVSPERSRRMLDAMSEPGLHHKFMCSLNDRLPEAALYRKSGTWRLWHSDSVLVWGLEGRRYILAALVEDEDGEALLQEIATVVDDLMTREAERAGD